MDSSTSSFTTSHDDANSWQQRQYHDVQDLYYGTGFDRWLAGRQDDGGFGRQLAKEEPLDYSVLSVGVMTLGLILMVEVIRHRLDHEAEHRPFFKVVLEATYSELATLGLVELCVFLLLRYYELQNKERKEIFAEVHFALFYTAIFNAFQSVMCAFATKSVSQRLWVQTEHLELDHYVEIREEFDKVSQKYHAQRGTFDEAPMGTKRVTSWWKNVWSSLRDPGLRHRYFELLVQVRFHQLRIQFLENNHLPLNFKVSEYLKRSEETVLMHMVHVSGTAWIMLTAGFNLLYFAMGMVSYRTEDPYIVGTTLMIIFFSMLVLFIVICIVLYLKMRRIFEDILEMKHLCDSDQEAGAQQQRNLFWFNEPQSVIAIIQFMQFGYAIALSIVIMFWSDLGEVEPYYYFVVTLCCYSIFVFVLSKVLPQFTLCTSLGHLVNKEHLNETLAMHKLVEAQRRRKRKMLQLTFGENLDDCVICRDDDDDDDGFMKDATCGGIHTTAVAVDLDNEKSDSIPTSTKTGSTLGSGSDPSNPDSATYVLRSLGDNVRSRKSLMTDQSSDSGDSHVLANNPGDEGMTESIRAKNNSTLLAELVKMDTSQLRQQLPERSQNRLMQRGVGLQQRRANRKKSVSDGVAAMRSMGHGMSPAARNVFKNNAYMTPLETNTKTVAPANVEPLLKGSMDDAESARQDRVARLANRKASRKKAVSASSVIQSWRNIDASSKPKSPFLSKIEESTPKERKKSSSASDVIQDWHNMGNGIASRQSTIPLRGVEDSEGPKFMLKNPVNANAEKTTDDPAKIHRRLRAERLAQQRRDGRKSLSASAVIQSWRDFSIADSPSNFASKTSDELGLPLDDNCDDAALSKKSADQALGDELGLPLDDDCDDAAVSMSADQALGDVLVSNANGSLLEVSEGVALAEIASCLPEIHVALSGGDESPTHANGTVQIINLADASLVPAKNETFRRTKKSVGFSSMGDDDSFDHAATATDDDEDGDDDGSRIRRPTKTDTDDASTVDTDRSMGELSDVAKLAPSEFESLCTTYRIQEPSYVKLFKRLAPSAVKKELHEYFLSDYYPLCSHVFGSVVAFFLIGMRVETFNAITGAVAPSENTWELRLNVAFWWQAAWYMLFLVVSSLAAWAVNPAECKSTKERRVFAAAVVDLFLATLCLTLLFVAEALRCCDVEDYDFNNFGGRLLRLLAGEEYGTSNGTTLSADEDELTDSYPYPYSNPKYNNPAYYQCCPFWGFRTYGGVGNIEPFTALIGLRVLRFWASKYLVTAILREGNKKEAGSHSTDVEHSSEDHHHHDHDGGQGHGDSHGHGHGIARGTAVELWQRAILKHPDIVQKYGQFSGELFQAMLGLEIIDDDKLSKSKSYASSKQVTPYASSGDLLAIHDEDKNGQSLQSSSLHYKLTGDRYSCLSAECQGIILAGKLGMPMKSMRNLQVLEQSPSGGNLPTLLEEFAAEEDHQGKSRLQNNLEFEVDDDLLAKEEDIDSDFIAPNARLIRSMRRCDRKLYPLLKEWIPVDVVITDYEIVYFDVESDTEQYLSEELRMKKEALHLALQATKGGKGLRLMDVAAGRKVVGHLDLSDVTQIHVERDMPVLETSHLECEEQSKDIQNQVPSEYWLKSTHIEVQTQSRPLRWAKVKEDRLKVVSVHGTLFLRYYSDLNDVESHYQESMAEDELAGSLRKDIAFQWAQTIAHICGQDQLKQPLPHFGTNDSEELRDYLEVIHHKADENRIPRRVRNSLFEPSQSLAQSEHGATDNEDATGELNRPKLRYSKSFGDNKYDKVGSASFRFFRRSGSAGDHDTGLSRSQSVRNISETDIEEVAARHGVTS